jgi:hypothetical protein
MMAAEPDAGRGSLPGVLLIGALELVWFAFLAWMAWRP